MQRERDSKRSPEITETETILLEEAQTLAQTPTRTEDRTIVDMAVEEPRAKPKAKVDTQEQDPTTETEAEAQSTTARTTKLTLRHRKYLLLKEANSNYKNLNNLKTTS
jgi:hypothetical protein